MEEEVVNSVSIEHAEPEMIVESTEVIEQMTVTDEAVEQVDDGNIVVESLGGDQFIQPVSVMQQTAHLTELANQHHTVELDSQLYAQQSDNPTILSDVILRQQGSSA